jgi:hypothetical protein
LTDYIDEGEEYLGCPEGATTIFKFWRDGSQLFVCNYHHEEFSRNDPDPDPSSRREEDLTPALESYYTEDA